ncbi:MAG TPA: PIN domain-containing protein [Pyrinomonadaceae bacterium]|nr:PIN domain-containing protein [Pyrinomonadaceae bacterium]
MRTNFVLIDSENVKPESVEKLKHKHFRVVVFLGANQKRIDSAIVLAVHSLGDSGSYVQVSDKGKDALDFHIAYYIGKFSAAEPDACFHIISKDKGFDPLVKHLREQKISCSRVASLSDIPPLKLSEKANSKDRAADFYEKRIASNKARPATVRALQRTILSHFRDLSTQEITKVVDGLKRAGHIEINGEKVAYP